MTAFLLHDFIFFLFRLSKKETKKDIRIRLQPEFGLFPDVAFVLLYLKTATHYCTLPV